MARFLNFLSAFLYLPRLSSLFVVSVIGWFWIKAKGRKGQNNLCRVKRDSEILIHKLTLYNPIDLWEKSHHNRLTMRSLSTSVQSHADWSKYIRTPDGDLLPLSGESFTTGRSLTELFLIFLRCSSSDLRSVFDGDSSSYVLLRFLLRFVSN